MKLIRFSFLVCALMSATAEAYCGLAVTVSPPKVAGQKAVVRLALENHFQERIESARAVTFLLDEQGKMVAQATKWVIGGSARPATGDKAGLAPGATNVFHFVVTSDKPFA